MTRCLVAPATTTLVGSAGADILAGEDGDDTYEIVDDDDVVIEAPG